MIPTQISPVCQHDTHSVPTIVIHLSPRFPISCKLLVAHFEHLDVQFNKDFNTVTRLKLWLYKQRVLERIYLHPM